MSAYPQSRRSLEEGFTLVEMLVVLVIIGLTASILVPAVRPIRERAIASRCIDDVSSLLHHARHDALANGVPRHVDYSGITRRFILRETGEAKAVPSDVTLDLVTASEALSPTLRRQGDAAAFLFLPDGTTSGGSVRVHVGSAVRTMRMSWLTGVLTDVP